MTNKPIPCIWFHTKTGKLSEVIEYYKIIFTENFKNEEIVSLGNTPSGNAEITNAYIFNSKYSFMSTEIEHIPLNDAISLILECSDQNEIDIYWDYFTKEGKEYECGWCIDKFGLRWQIIPSNLRDLVNKPNGNNVLSKQKKIIINEYLN